MITVGVLAIQGAFAEHLEVLNKLGVKATLVRNAKDLAQVDGLIIPGGESTSIGILCQQNNFLKQLKEFTQTKPTWGTCAGMILLAETLSNPSVGQTTLGGMNITVRRNYFGAQVKSFESHIQCPALGEKPFHAIFIRAPVIEKVETNVQTLAQLSEKEIIAVRQGHLLATAFHPELTQETQWHEYFVKMIQSTVQ